MTERVIEVFGAGRVGYKISPTLPLNSMADSDPEATFPHLARRLSALGIGYLHVAEAIAGPTAPPADTRRLAPILRDVFDGTLILGGGYDAASGERALTNGEADLIAYGMPFIANPDLPRRFAGGLPLAQPDYAKLYAGGDQDASGYTDYPPPGSVV